MVTVIPKDCLLCDVCSRELVNPEGEILEDFIWTEWGLVCDRHETNSPVCGAFMKGQVVPPNHFLWAPIVISDWAARRSSGPRVQTAGLA